MAAKICIFAMDTYSHRTNMLHLFPPVQKLFGATL